MLTDEQVKALRDGCEGVTPGPWAAEIWNNGQSAVVSESAEVGGDDDWIVCEAKTRSQSQQRDNVHIARCDPQTISELCTRVLEAEAANRRLREALKPFSKAGLTTRLIEAEARVKVLKDALHEIADELEQDGRQGPWAWRRARKALEAEK